MQSKAKRNSNIELLRIVAMLIIVAHHYAAFGFFEEELAFSRNKIPVDLFGMFVRVGVDLFVLISGYYMVSSRFRLKKLLTLMGSVWFYSLGMLLFFGVTRLVPVGREELKGALFPLLTGQYWFMSYYVLLMLLSPFLNVLIGALSRESHAALCLLLFALSTLLPELLKLHFLDGILPLFTALYLCGAYLRLYLRESPRATRRCALLLALLAAFCIVRLVCTDLIGQRTGNIDMLARSLDFLGVYSPLAFLVALALTALACGRPQADNRLFSRVGGLCFGVYLFHANPLLGEIVWQRVFHTAQFVDSPLLLMHALLTVAALFATGCLVEELRLRSFARLWDRAVDAVLPALDTLLRRLGAGLLRLTDRLIDRQ